VVHYLDDFLAILPPHESPGYYRSRFAELGSKVGLSFAKSKRKEGTTLVFGGVEMDTANMVIRLPLRKLHKARTLVQTASNQSTFSFLKLQSITGY